MTKSRGVLLRVSRFNGKRLMELTLWVSVCLCVTACNNGKTTGTRLATPQLFFFPITLSKVCSQRITTFTFTIS